MTGIHAPPTRRKKRLLAGLGLSVATLVVLELVLRLFVASWGWIDTFEFDRASPPCFAMKPHTSGVYEGWWTRVRPTTVTINSKGLRDTERAPRPPAGVVRIAALGDSHVFGLGTELEEGIPRQLEAALRARGPASVEVINAGVPGYDLPKEVDLLPRVLDDYAPQKVLFFIDGGDLEEVPCAFWKDRVRPLLRYSLLARAFYVLVLRSVNSPRSSAPPGARLERLGRELERLRATLSSRDPRAQVAFVKLDRLRRHGDPDHRERLFDERFRAAGFTVLGVDDVFDRLRAEPEKYVVVGEGHLNARGIEQLVTAVAERAAAAGFWDLR